MTRTYLKRAAQFSWAGKTIELSPYWVADDVIDAEGTCDGQAFDSLNDLMRLTRWDKATADGFVGRMRELLNA